MSFVNLFGVHYEKPTSRSGSLGAYFTKDLALYTIPDGVTSIRPYCFYNFWPEVPLKVVIPNTVTSISSFAFTECNIKEIVIPSSVKVICSNAFVGTVLESALFNEGLEEIGDRAFANGPLLKQVILPDSLKKIGESAFEGMGTVGGAIVEIGSGIESIGANAFDCSVKSLVIHKDYGSIEDGFSGYFDDEGVWYDPKCYGGRTENPDAIWDGDI